MAAVTTLDPHVAEPQWGRVRWLGVALPGHLALRVWQRDLDVFLNLWKVNLFPPLAEPLIMILAMGLGLGSFVELTGDQEYIQFIAPGVMAVIPMFAGIGEALWGAFFRLEQQFTYQAILATPARAEDIITGEVLWAATRTLISAAMILLVMAVLTPSYDLIASPLALLTLPVALLMGLLFANIGIAYTSFASSLHHLMYFFTLALTPMFWFSGVFFPLDDLPSWVGIVGWFIPLSHVVEIMRSLVQGDPGLAEFWDLLWLLVATAGTFWLALWTMRRRLVR